MSEDIASRDYEAEIYLLKAEIKRLEAEVEGMKCCGNCGKWNSDRSHADMIRCNQRIGNGAFVCDGWEERK